jgi:hypothetical protein
MTQKLQRTPKYLLTGSYSKPVKSTLNIHDLFLYNIVSTSTPTRSEQMQINRCFVTYDM